MMMNSIALPIQTPADFAPFINLLALIADPKASQARVDQLAAASLAAQTIIDEANQSQKDLVAARAAHDHAIAQERGAHVAALATERVTFEVESDRRNRDLTARETAVAALETQAKTDAAAAVRLKNDLQDRLARIQAVAA